MIIIPEITHRLSIYGITFRLCGSRVTCNPPPLTTDIDWLVSVPSHIQYDTYAVPLTLDGWSLESLKGTVYANDQNEFVFTSWRKDEHNLIISNNQDFIKRHNAATAVCTRLNLMYKPDRIALFQAVLYGEVYKG